MSRATTPPGGHARVTDVAVVFVLGLLALWNGLWLVVSVGRADLLGEALALGVVAGCLVGLVALWRRPTDERLETTVLACAAAAAFLTGEAANPVLGALALALLLVLAQRHGERRRRARDRADR